MAEQPVFLVDTSIFIAHLRQSKTPTILDKAREQYGAPVTSDIVVFELEVGARRVGRTFEFRQRFGSIYSYPLTQDILIRAADIQATLLSRNEIVGLPDTFLAATALHENLPLLTLNVGHFQRIDGLNVLAVPPR